MHRGTCLNRFAVTAVGFIRSAGAGARHLGIVESGVGCYNSKRNRAGAAVSAGAGGPGMEMLPSLLEAPELALELVERAVRRADARGN